MFVICATKNIVSMSMFRKANRILWLAWPWLFLIAASCVPRGEHLPSNVMVIGQVAEPKSLDPHVATSLNDFRILGNIYEGLVRFADGTLELESSLAESWQISDDGKTYTFRLQRGITFHDGTPFDAYAVKFNFERMLDDKHPYHHTGPFPLAFFFEKVEDVRTVAPYTVQFVLEQPFAPFLSNLAYPTGFIISPAAVQKHAKAFSRHPVGTGPFRFVEWSAQRRVVLERNPEYHGQASKSEIIVFRPISDPMTRVAELMAGGVDVVMELSPDNIALLRNRSDFAVHEQTGPHLWFLILNTREGPFQDRRMRQALNYAIDKQALVRNVLQNTATVATGPVPEAFSWAYDNSVMAYPHDPEKARALIRAAGYEKGVEVTLLAPQEGSGMLAPVQMAAAIQGDLARLGIRTRIQSYEWNTFLSKINAGLAGQGDMAEMAWMTNDPDTLFYLALRSAALPERGGFNSGYYANPRVDALTEAARTTTNRSERAALYRQLQRLVHADAPWVFVASWRQNAVTHNALQGFRLQPSFFLLLKDVAKL